LSEAKEEETYKGIALALKMWRDFDMSVLPKLHVLEDHLYSQLSLFKGLGDYSEDFVEQAHQVGTREEARTFAMKDRNCIAEIHCQNDCLQLRIFRQQWQKNRLESENSHKL
jgi:hypothetical protein